MAAEAVSDAAIRERDRREEPTVSERPRQEQLDLADHADATTDASATAPSVPVQPGLFPVDPQRGGIRQPAALLLQGHPGSQDRQAIPRHWNLAAQHPRRGRPSAQAW